MLILVVTWTHLKREPQLKNRLRHAGLWAFFFLLTDVGGSAHCGQDHPQKMPWIVPKGSWMWACKRASRKCPQDLFFSSCLWVPGWLVRQSKPFLSKVLLALVSFVTTESRLGCLTSLLALPIYWLNENNTNSAQILHIFHVLVVCNKNKIFLMLGIGSRCKWAPDCSYPHVHEGENTKLYSAPCS